jgi:hypothetical protein
VDISTAFVSVEWERKLTRLYQSKIGRSVERCYHDSTANVASSAAYFFSYLVDNKDKRIQPHLLLSLRRLAHLTVKINPEYKNLFRLKGESLQI